MESNPLDKPKLSKKNSLEDFKNLIQFYYACIEEEDLHSLTLKLTQYHRSFISPWDEREPFFHTETAEINFDVQNKLDHKLLNRGLAQAGEAERFFYGYPVFKDRKDHITPLFIQEVDVTISQAGGFILRPQNPNAIQVNHHLFRQQHKQVEEIQAIQEELEGTFGSFQARLRTALEYLDTDIQFFDPLKIDLFPKRGTYTNCWVNRPILFRSERSTYTNNLKKDLIALIRYNSLFKSVGETVLYQLLAPIKENKTIDHRDKVAVLEVLPLNELQEKAVKSGLTSPLTVVTGPPGTGKSQVVVDILASSVLSGQTVLFASKNNKAVDVVYDRIHEILGKDHDWVLRLGSRKKKATCQENISSSLKSLIGGAHNVLESPSQEPLNILDKEILSVRNQLEKVRQANLSLEATYMESRMAKAAVPENWIKTTNENKLPVIPFSLLINGKNNAMAMVGDAPMGLWLWLKNLLMGQRLKLELYQILEKCVASTPETIKKDILSEVQNNFGYHSMAIAFQQLSLYRDWVEVTKKLQEAEKQIIDLPNANILAENIQELKERKAKISKEFFKTTWTQNVSKRFEIANHEISRYFELAERIFSHQNAREWVQVLNDFTETIKNLGKTFPIWIVTNLSARRSLPLQPNLFDLVIIDEASQCDIPSALPLLFRSRRAVIIGDPRQLRHISTISPNREAQIANENKAELLLSDWSYTACSIYDIAKTAIQKKESAPILLAEHYRSHPAIVEFSNRVFYQRKLILRTSVSTLKSKLKNQPLGVFWHDVSGYVPKSSRSAWNEAEVSKTIEIFNSWYKLDFLSQQDIRFGIVTPFRLQMEKMKQALNKQPWWDEIKDRLIVGTAHAFQGDECDIMIFSPVVAKGLGKNLCRWVADTDQLLNVAITRARGAMHVVGDLHECRLAGSYLSEFAEYVASGNIAGQTEARFDSPAEEHMADILDEIGLWYLPQYPEGRYRFDFLVVSPFGTRYDLEVDGRGHWTAEQMRIDEVRDKVVEELGYNVIRIDARDLFNREDIVKARISRLS